MIITIASGKGGTGKTTVAVSLALSLADSARPGPPLFLDCDVEEPNAALFLCPTVEERREVGLPIPEVDFGTCTYCGRCAQVCQYHAIAVVDRKVLIFPELCHGCGACTLSCPPGAIHEVLHVTGTLERGWAQSPTGAGSIEFAQGIMNVGEPMATPIIRALKRWALPSSARDRPIILDAAPGASCAVVEAMRGADFVLLVTEPTPFGLHDLRQAVQIARRELSLPVGVVINRDGVGDRGVEAYCQAEGVPILMRIPLERRIAETYSDGVPLVRALPEYAGRFRRLYESVERLAPQREGASAR